MRNIIIVLVMLTICSSCAAQTGNAIISKSNNIRLTWAKVQSDYQGEIISYTAFVATYFDTSGIDSFAVNDTTLTINMEGKSDGLYRYGVRAKDDSGNKSAIIWCDDQLNLWGQWYFRRDTKAPFWPIGIRGTF